jgi:hypothetical protein
LCRYPHIPVIEELSLSGVPYRKPNQFAEYIFANNTAVLMNHARLDPVPLCNDRLDDATDVSHFTTGWVDGTPGIFGIGGW